MDIDAGQAAIGSVESQASPVSKSGTVIASVVRPSWPSALKIGRTGLGNEARTLGR
jgi:hypothetical protein